MIEDWVEVGSIGEIPRNGSRIVRGPQGDIAVFRTSDDRIFALDDRCPHRGGPLSQGIVHGTAVTCPLHGWVIRLDDGKVEGPDEGCVARIPVDVWRGRVFLRLRSIADVANG